MGGKTETKTTQNNTIDRYTRAGIDGAKRNVGRIVDGNPFEAYQGERVAGQTGLQRDARSMYQQNAGQGAGLLGEAADAARQAGGYAPQQVEAQSFANADLSAYQNPYLDNVLSTTMQGIDRSRAEARVGDNARATMAGAFGGDRQAVGDAVRDRDTAQLKASTEAGLRSQAFSQAAGLFHNDANRQLQADTTNAGLGVQGAQLNLQGAGLLGQFGEAADGMNRANAGLLNAFGSQDQATEQARLDADYGEMLRERDDMYRQIATQLSLGGLTPIVTDSTGTQTTRQTPGVGQIAGLGMQAATLFSDQRLKKNIFPSGRIGRFAAYLYHYIWQGDDAPLNHGVMAQDVMGEQPDAVSRHPSGFLMVDYSKLGAA